MPVEHNSDWIMLLFLFSFVILQATAIDSECPYSSPILPAGDERPITTLKASFSGSYKSCNTPSNSSPGNASSGICWSTFITWLRSPIKTSVACGGSVTYILGQQGTECRPWIPVEATSLVSAHTSTSLPEDFDECATGLLEQLQPESGEVSIVMRPPILLPMARKVGKICGRPLVESCELIADGVKLYYFPPSTESSRNMCATTAITAPALLSSYSEDAPSAVIDGTTFRTDRVYVSFGTLFARSKVTTIGGNSTTWIDVDDKTSYINRLFTLKSEDISSLRYPYIHHNTHPFNYADLTDPVPLSAWLGVGPMPEQGGFTILPHYARYNVERLQVVPMDNQRISTLGSPVYEPIIAVPKIIPLLHSRWQSCVINGWIDPPIPLTPAFGPMREPKPVKFFSPTATVDTVETSSLVDAPRADWGQPAPASRIQPHQPTATKDGEFFPTNPPANVVFGSTTLRSGEPAVTLSNGKVISAESRGVVVDQGSSDKTTIPYKALASGSYDFASFANQKELEARLSSALEHPGADSGANGVDAYGVPRPQVFEGSGNNRSRGCLFSLYIAWLALLTMTG